MNSIVKTSTGVAVANRCDFWGLTVYTDGTNDATVTLHDNASAASGDYIMPPQVFDATVKAIHGFKNTAGEHCKKGIYVTIAGAGTCYVKIDYGAWIKN
jgi:hypothetical protein